MTKVYDVTSSNILQGTFTVSLDSLEGLDYVYLRYQAETYILFWGEEWKTDRMYAEVIFIVDTEDLESPNFTFAGNDPFV